MEAPIRCIRHQGIHCNTQGVLQITIDSYALKAAVESGLALLGDLSTLQQQLRFTFDRSPVFASMEAAVRAAARLWREYVICYKAEALKMNPPAARN